MFILNESFASVTFILANLFAYFTLKKHSGLGTTRINNSTLFYLLFLILVDIGSLALVYNPELLINVLVSDDLNETLLRHSIHMNISIVFFSFGVISASYICNFNYKQRSIAYSEKKAIRNPNATVHKVFTAIGIIISIFIMEYYFSSLEFIPLKEAIINILTNHDSGLAQMRHEITYDTSIPGWFLQFIRIILPFLICYGWMLFRKSPDIFYFSFLLPSTCYMFYSLFSLGQRAPLLEFLISCFIMYGYSTKEKVFKFRLLAVTAIILFVTILLLTLLLERAGGGEDLSQRIAINIDQIAYRIFITSAQTGSYLYQLIPRIIDFQNFDIYLENLRGYLPGYANSFSVDLFSIVHTKSGSASHSCITEAYASFGLSGVCIVSLLVGFMTQIVTIYSLIFKKSDMNIVTTGFLTIILSDIAVGSLTGIFYNGLVSLILLNILMRTLFAIFDTVYMQTKIIPRHIQYGK